MSTFKILVGKEIKSVYMKGNFNEFKTYNELKRKLIDKSQAQCFKSKKYNLKESDVFILHFDVEGDIFIPDDLKKENAIWDNKTYGYFKEKLSLRKISNAYKFYVEKVKRLPRWKKKENHEYLSDALEKCWDPIYEDIIAGVSLMKLEESKVVYSNKQKKLEENNAKLNKEKHNNVICNNCHKKDFCGKRFICAECNNYNLCQECEKIFYQKQIHQREHTLIQINKSLNDENVDNLSKYSNIIGNNNQEFKNVPSSFQLEFTVINNGENDLKDCYLLPVRYGDEYLTCNPKKIEDNIQRNMSVKIVLVVRIPNINKGYFEGYFRMFTPHGLPFGNVLFVKVLNGD